MITTNNRRVQEKVIEVNSSQEVILKNEINIEH